MKLRMLRRDADGPYRSRPRPEETFLPANEAYEVYVEQEVRRGVKALPRWLVSLVVAIALMDLNALLPSVRALVRRKDDHSVICTSDRLFTVGERDVAVKLFQDDLDRLTAQGFFWQWK